MLSARKISKSLGKSKILSDVSLAIEPGQITTIIGPSGGGKSTLVRALSLLDPPDQGELVLEGKIHSFPSDTKPANDPPWPELGVVFQQLFLWPHLTLRDNIMLPLTLNGNLHKSSLADELIDFFELSEAADRYPNETSVGQRQRVALIRAIVLEPRYLLLDEITSALDVEHVGKVLEQLRKLKSKGVGVLVVTHLLGFAANSADQVIFMDKGQIVESGRAEILTNPNSERLRKFLSLAASAL